MAISLDDINTQSQQSPANDNYSDGARKFESKVKLEIKIYTYTLISK